MSGVTDDAKVPEPAARSDPPQERPRYRPLAPWERGGAIAAGVVMGTVGFVAMFLHARMQEHGSAAGTAHQAHRTIRTALNEAVRLGHLARNPATLAKAPRLAEEEIEPYSVEEVRRLLVEAGRRRNSARWAVALALGLRQGEVLGLQWADVDLDKGTLRVRRGRLRPKYAHGCEGSCGRQAVVERRRLGVCDADRAAGQHEH